MVLSEGQMVESFITCNFQVAKVGFGILYSQPTPLQLETLFHGFEENCTAFDAFPHGKVVQKCVAPNEWKRFLQKKKRPAFPLCFRGKVVTMEKVFRRLLRSYLSKPSPPSVLFFAASHKSASFGAFPQGTCACTKPWKMDDYRKAKTLCRNVVTQMCSQSISKKRPGNPPCQVKILDC